MITTKIYYRAAGTDFDELIFQDTGASTKRTIDNSLNSGLLQLSKQTRQIGFPRLHGITVVFDDGTDTKTEYYRILGDVVTLESKGDNKRYKHEIQLIEPTKLHERTYVGSKSFSRNKDGSAKYTMDDVLIVFQTIGRFQREDILIFDVKLFNISNSVHTILGRIDAPQLFFKNVHLREGINGLLSYIDATYELDIDNNIILRFFNEITGEITDVGIFDDEMRITTGDYYSTEMDINAQNLVNDKALLPTGTPTGINRHTINNLANGQNSQNRKPFPIVALSLGTFGSAGSTTGGALPPSANYRENFTCDINGYLDPTSGITFDQDEIAVYGASAWTKAGDIFGISSSVGSYFRSEDVVLGDSNMIIKLVENLKLYEVEDIYIGVRDESANEVFTALCTEFFVTDAQYALLDNAPNFLGIPTIDEFPDRQSAARYKIGGQEAEGFGDTWGVFGLQRTIDNMVKSITKRGTDNLGGELGVIGLQLDPFDNEQILFTFVYRPIVPRMRITAARTSVEDMNIRTSVRENQDENVVSVQNYGSNLLAKANRVGNEILIHTETVTKVSALKDRGYRLPTKHILTEVEKVIWPEFIKAKYTFVKLFNKLSQFIGLAGRRRQFELLPEDTVDRALNYTEYLQVVPGDVAYQNDTVFSDFAIERIIESLLFTYADNTVRGAIITSDDFDIDPTVLFNYTAGDIAGIYLPVFKTGAAKSLLFTFSFQDTLSAGDRIQQEDVGGTDVRSKRAVAYTTVEGELGKARIKFINYVNPEWAVGGKVDFDKFKNDAKNAPALILNNVNLGADYLEYANGEYRFDKDLAERISFTQQLQFLGYETEVGVGNEWARLCNLILDLPGPTLYLYTSDSEYGLLEDKKIKVDATKLGDITNYASLINKQIVLNSSGIAAVDGVTSWAIGDGNENLSLFVNQTIRSIIMLSFIGYNKRPGVINNVAEIPLSDILTADILTQAFTGSVDYNVLLSNLLTSNEPVLGILTGAPQIKELGTYRIQLSIDYDYSTGLGHVEVDQATGIQNVAGNPSHYQNRTGLNIVFLFTDINTVIPDSIDLGVGITGFEEIRIKQGDITYNMEYDYEVDLDAELGLFPGSQDDSGSMGDSNESVRINESPLQFSAEIGRSVNPTKGQFEFDDIGLASMTVLEDDIIFDFDITYLVDLLANDHDVFHSMGYSVNDGPISRIGDRTLNGDGTTVNEGVSGISLNAGDVVKYHYLVEGVGGFPSDPFDGLTYKFPVVVVTSHGPDPGQNTCTIELVARYEPTGEIRAVIDSVFYDTGGIKSGILAGSYKVDPADAGFIGIVPRLVVTGEANMEQSLDVGSLDINSDFGIDLRFDLVLETSEGEITSQVLDARFPELNQVINYEVPANQLNKDISLTLKGRYFRVAEGTITINPSSLKIGKLE